MLRPLGVKLEPLGVRLLNELAGLKIDSHPVVPLSINKPQTEDELGHAIYATSTYQMKNAAGKAEYGNKESTDDQIILGHTADGLPFQIVVDGFHRHDREKNFEFVRSQVVPLLAAYAEKLAKSDAPEELSKALINSIFERVMAVDGTTEAVAFTMSLALTYKKGDQLFAAGFGVGDTGIIIKRQNGMLQQVVDTVQVEGFKDGFDATTAQLPRDLVMTHSTVFNEVVSPGDEIVGYTSLSDGLLKPKRCASSYKKVGSMFKEELEIKVPFVRQSIRDNIIRADRSLLDHLVEVNQLACAQDYTKLLNDRWTGDDCMFGSMTIPPLALQEKFRFLPKEPDIFERTAEIPDQAAKLRKRAATGETVQPVSSPAAPNRSVKSSLPPQSFFNRHWGKMLIGALVTLAVVALVVFIPPLGAVAAIGGWVLGATIIKGAGAAIAFGLTAIAGGSLLLGMGAGAAVGKAIDCNGKTVSSSARAAGVFMNSKPAEVSRESSFEAAAGSADPIPPTTLSFEGGDLGMPDDSRVRRPGSVNS